MRTANTKVEERGYVLPMTALLLIPMMLFAGFATDVGSWFLRGQRTQVAADAGAAAGVVWIPDPTAYSNNALEAVRRNGFPTASLVTSFAAAEASPTPPPLPWVEVTLTTNSTLEVAIRTEADTFFTSPVLDSVSLTRRAEAQYIEPTPLGNPTSALGTGGDTEYPGTPDNFYLQTRSDTRRNGDIIGPATGVFGTPNPLFTGLAARPELQGAYFYEIEVPAGAAGLYRLELRVSCRNQSNSGELNWSVYAPDGTDTDFTDNVAAGAIASGTRERTDNTCTDADPADGFDTSTTGRIETATDTHVQFIDTAQWIPMQDLMASGTYVLRMRADSGEILYSIRAVRLGASGPAQHCTSIPLPNETGGTDGATPDCPSISAIDWLGSAALEDTLPNGNDPIEIFLTEVRPELAGNQLEVTLFDPADGIECVRILDPFGTPVPFTWRTIDNEVWGYFHDEYNTFTNGGGTGDLPDTNSVACGTSGDTALTDPRLPANQTGGVGQIFQDRTVRFFLTVGTPPCNGSNCWYKVQYEKGGSAADRDLYDWNSWAVRVVGDPVRLIR
jgi:hypothetical protein